MLDSNIWALIAIKHKADTARVNQWVRILSPEVVELDEDCRLCDFVFIVGGQGIKIGKHTDIQPGVKIWGGGSCTIGDYVSVGPNAVILTGEYLYQTADGLPLMMVDHVPNHEAVYGHTVIGDHAYIGANATIRQGVTIGEGAVVGMGAVVNKDVEPWAIVAGVPARFMKWRPKL